MAEKGEMETKSLALAVLILLGRQPSLGWWPVHWQDVKALVGSSHSGVSLLDSSSSSTTY